MPVSSGRSSHSRLFRSLDGRIRLQNRGQIRRTGHRKAKQRPKLRPARKEVAEEAAEEGVGKMNDHHAQQFVTNLMDQYAKRYELRQPNPVSHRSGSSRSLPTVPAAIVRRLIENR